MSVTLVSLGRTKTYERVAARRLVWDQSEPGSSGSFPSDLAKQLRQME